MKYTILLLAIIILASCSTEKKCNKAQRDYEAKMYKFGCAWKLPDTVEKEKIVTIIKDSIVYLSIPGESKTNTTFPLSGKRSFLSTRYANSEAWIEKDSVHHTLTQIQSEVPKVILGAIRQDVIIKEKQVKVPYPVDKLIKKPYSHLEWFVSVSGVLAWVLIVLFMILRLRKYLPF